MRVYHFLVPSLFEAQVRHCGDNCIHALRCQERRRSLLMHAEASPRWHFPFPSERAGQHAAVETGQD